MKPAQAITILSALLLASLGGCSILAENHPTTESRFMTPQEQAASRDPQSRHDKADEWARNLQRQSSDRMARLFD